MPAVASRVGADVPLFLTGGTILMSGTGEEIEVVRRAEGFAVAIVVPEFGLSTSEVYRRWDELEGPTGEEISEHLLPPSLRGRMPMRNDLLPAAIAVEPLLGDFMADVRAKWSGAVAMTGSGSACFGYFATLDEASDAASAVAGIAPIARAASLRPHGVAVLPPEEE
jgi:4-diphosphocytidyl-2-C-methyl-D-erythritol kinase